MVNNLCGPPRQPSTTGVALLRRRQPTPLPAAPRRWQHHLEQQCLEIGIGAHGRERHAGSGFLSEWGQGKDRFVQGGIFLAVAVAGARMMDAVFAASVIRLGSARPRSNSGLLLIPRNRSRVCASALRRPTAWLGAMARDAYEDHSGRTQGARDLSIRPRCLKGRQLAPRTSVRAPLKSGLLQKPFHIRHGAENDMAETVAGVVGLELGSAKRKFISLADRR